MTEQKITYDEWEKKGEALFGKNKREWKFVCPNCKHIQSFNDYLALGISAEEANKFIGFSCIGRCMKDCKGEFGNKIAPCNYAGGGLFRLNPITIVHEGKEQTYFDFYEVKK